MIPIYEPTLNGNEKKYVLECLETNWISSKGKFSDLFCEKFSEYSSINYSTTVSNGTCALQLALATLNIPIGSEVLIPSFGYVAVASSVVRHGAIPVFVDINPDDLQINHQDLERKLTLKSKAIIGIHNYGYPYESYKVNEIAKQNNLFHIEDCAEAIGTLDSQGRHVGNQSDISIFSLYANKTITAGEGGLLCTNNNDLHEKAVQLKNHSISCPGIYDHNDFGFNFRMTNIAAAIALAQLENIHEKLERKKIIAKKYREQIKNNKIRLLDPNPEKNMHSYWMNTLITQNNYQAEEIRNQLFTNNIESRPLFKPVHLMTPYKKFFKEPLIESEKINGCGLNLPSSPSLTDSQIDFIINIINQIKFN